MHEIEEILDQAIYSYANYSESRAKINLEKGITNYLNENEFIIKNIDNKTKEMI